MDPKGNKPAAEEMGVPSMMKQMMEKMCGGDVSPAAMCHGMRTSVGKTPETATNATPEVRKVFEEWVRSIEDEILAALKARGPLDARDAGRRSQHQPRRCALPPRQARPGGEGDHQLDPGPPAGQKRPFRARLGRDVRTLRSTRKRAARAVERSRDASDEAAPHVAFVNHEVTE